LIAASPNCETSFDLGAKRSRLSELEGQQSDAAFWANSDRARTVVQEIKQLKGWVTPAEDITSRVADARALAEMLDTEPDAGMAAELEAEAARLEEAVGAFQLRTMLRGPDDARDALLTIHPGAGGTESQDWAEMLMRMYVRWAERHGYQVSILDLLPGEEAGI